MTFDFNLLKKPSYFQENRLPAHSDHCFFANGEELRRRDASLVEPLNGLWQIMYAKNPAAAPQDFYTPEFDTSGWDCIPVPAHIQLEGYDIPQYSNYAYPWDGWADIQPGELPEDFNPTACYVKQFVLPEQFACKRVFLSFQGMESCGAVWLNGQYIGFSSNSFSPCEFELTNALCAGENKLCVMVVKWCSGSWMEDQDFFRFSGIYRDVFLYAAPAVHLADVSAVPELSEDCASGILNVSGTLLHSGGWRLLAVCGNCQEEVSGTGDTFSFSMHFRKPALWSAEQPHLYSLTLELYDEADNLVEVIPQQVGFRRFEVKDGLLCLNGRRIVFNGVNRHDFCGETGRAVPVEKIKRDLITMKRNNINAVRTCHYPNTMAFYHLCDRLGLYVISENNLETHGSWADPNNAIPVIPKDDETWRPMLLDRVNSTYQTGKNHPCILIWSLGNESNGGTVLRDMAERMHSLDAHRPVHYESIFHDRRFPETSDMESQMYTPVSGIEAFLAEHPEKPFISCEYAHAMGTSCGGLYLYTDLAKRMPRYQGGFIWDFIDQALLKKDHCGKPYYGYGGDFGDRPNDGIFSGNGLCYADGTPTPKMDEVKACYQPVDICFNEFCVTIVNRNLFTSTADYRCTVTLDWNGVPLQSGDFPMVVPPMESRVFPMPFVKETVPGEYTITVSFALRHDTEWASAGYEIAFGQMVYTVSAPEKKTVCPALRVVEGSFNVGVIGRGFRVLFSAQNGGLTSYQYGGKELMQAIPMPCFWRSVTENDYGCQQQIFLAQWKLADQFPSTRPNAQDNVPIVPYQLTRHTSGSVSIAFRYYLPTTPQCSCLVTYTVSGDGVVSTQVECVPPKELPAPPEFGMSFCMDADYDRLRWYGMSGESYVDRCKGARLGIHQASVADSLARYLRPQESGNRTGVRWAEVTDYKGFGLRFSGAAMEFSALHYTPHQLDCAQHPYDLPAPQSTTVRVLQKQCGIGGDDSWGSRPHPETLLHEPLCFRFTFQGVVPCHKPF